MNKDWTTLRKQVVDRIGEEELAARVARLANEHDEQAATLRQVRHAVEMTRLDELERD